MGWIAEKGKKTKKYPPFEELILERQYVALTTDSGLVRLAPPVAAAADLEHLAIEVYGPLDGPCLRPREAVQELSKLYQAANPEAMLRELWRRYKRLKERRQVLVADGQLDEAASLPDLSTLPQSRKLDD